MTRPSLDGRRSARAIVIAGFGAPVALALAGACFNFSGYSLSDSLDASDLPDQDISPESSDLPDDGVSTDTSGCELPTPKAKCSPFPPCGCDETTQCDFFGVVPNCVTRGTVDKGGACIAGECAPGLTCWSNACKPFCGES